MDEKFKVENKANHKYSKLAIYGLQYFTTQAILHLRTKLSSSDPDAPLASLRKRVFYDIEDRCEEMMKRLLSEKDFKYYMSWSGGDV